MQKVIYMIGLPGSGKSEKAKQIAKKENAVILSTDELRQTLFFNVNKQKKTNLLYMELYKRANRYLADGKSVLIDATNIERERRMKALSKFASFQKECYYMDVPYELCVERNSKRKRVVEERILVKMRKNFDFPLKNEGWDMIHIIHESSSYEITKEKITELLVSEVSYEKLFEELKSVEFFRKMKGFDQENPYHSMPLCQHTYGVIEYINEMYVEKDKLILQMAALFHDVGKLFCKTFKVTKGYYSYFGHEKVSSQIAFHFLSELGFEEEFIQAVLGIIEMHMLINYGGNEGATEIYHLLGDDLLAKLYFFREADTFAK
ncbi:AAA family ATPase [Bacillus sp. AFS017336]|uniref:AAA family ATPase n=1 Tax=Bacillus sp. AFS017336 TaxID=2033489 RepID=UPI000BF06EC9|nr:AAA family ATPase [Bacillus sp. AFS017336]PEL14387.1 phosphohydrolase [Bacillus sp. AFS017336]